MKGEITLKMLECIYEATASFADLTAAFFKMGYGSSSMGIMNEFGRKQIKRGEKVETNLKIKHQRQRFYDMLYKLKKDGLIEEGIKNEKSFFKITSKGKHKIEKLKKRQADALPNNSYKERDLKSGKFTIAVFDIPEKERKKRAWLRSVLKNLNFKMIQQSVWAGKVKIPEDFLDDLKELHLIDYVEIFEISKSGSLKQLT